MTAALAEAAASTRIAAPASLAPAAAAPKTGSTPSRQAEIYSLRDAGRGSSRPCITLPGDTPTTIPRTPSPMRPWRRSSCTPARPQTPRAVRRAQSASHRVSPGSTMPTVGLLAEIRARRRSGQRIPAHDRARSGACRGVGEARDPLRNSWQARRGDRALSERRAAPARYPPWAGTAATKVLLHEGKRDEAIGRLKEAAEQFPTSGETNRFLAAILREEGRFEEAIPYSLRRRRKQARTKRLPPISISRCPSASRRMISPRSSR